MTKTNTHKGRIGLLLSAAPGYSETFFRSKIVGLKESGFDLVLFCSENQHGFKGCPVVLLPQQAKNKLILGIKLMWVYLGLLPYVKTLRRFVQLERTDGQAWLPILKRLYTHAPVFKQDLDCLHFGFGTLALGCENMAAALQADMAVSFRGFDIGVYPIKHPQCYSSLWDKVSKIHVISDDIKQLLYSHGFRDQAPVVKITPAIDTHYFSTEQGHVGEEYPIQLITVARLHWKKGLEYTLEALALLKQQGIAFEYRIIGSGPEEEALKFACYQLGLQAQVFFLGKLGHEKVRQHLTQAQYYIQYSVQEGFCNAVLEAQAMGLLCVVSDAEGLAENVLEGKTGWVVAKRQPKALTNKLIEMISLPNKEKAKVMELSKNRVKQVFNLEKQQKLFETFYDDNI
ncbi:glycosyltransferase family 4 protein [Xanthomarina gelatinilytica]|uniref:glycosyltransferase family 4 protein n=1 Tax=Xanthomarina gelatinilytica TaxID=1137281 RepID=UPI003AA90F21